jgi:hypothetical protein
MFNEGQNFTLTNLWKATAECRQPTLSIYSCRGQLLTNYGNNMVQCDNAQKIGKKSYIQV